MEFKGGKQPAAPSPLRTKVADTLKWASLHAVTRFEHAWGFSFSSGNLTTESHWRVVSGGRLLLTSDDDGQQFGLPEPVDTEAAAQAALVGGRVCAVELDVATADLRIAFEDGFRLEVISTSAGYEAWRLNTPGSCIVANGGRLSEAREVQPGLMVGGPWE